MSEELKPLAKVLAEIDHDGCFDDGGSQLRRNYYHREAGRLVGKLAIAGYIVAPTPPTDAAAVAGERETRQRTVADWCAAAFGIGQASSIEQRGIRLLEEAIEAYQACGAPADMAHKMVDYIFARPAGTIGQELGGVGVTTLALANAAGLSADDCEAKEVARVLAKPLSHFAARNQAKNDAGFCAAEAARSAPPAAAGDGRNT